MVGEQSRAEAVGVYTGDVRDVDPVLLEVADRRVFVREEEVTPGVVIASSEWAVVADLAGTRLRVVHVDSRAGVEVRAAVAVVGLPRGV